MNIRLAAAMALACAAVAHAPRAAADITLSVSNVTFTPPDGTTWNVDTYAVGSDQSMDRLQRAGAGPQLVVFVDAVASPKRCVDVFAAGGGDGGAVSSPAYLPTRFYPTAYETVADGASTVTMCGDLPSGYLFAIVKYAGATSSADFARTVPDLLSKIAQAKSLDDVRSHGIDCPTASRSHAQIAVPRGRWALVDAQGPDQSVHDAVVRMVPSRPSIQVFFEERNQACTAGDIDGAVASDDDQRVFWGMYTIQHHWIAEHGDDAVVYACGRLSPGVVADDDDDAADDDGDGSYYGARPRQKRARAMWLTVFVKGGSVSDLARSDYENVVLAIYHGLRAREGDETSPPCDNSAYPEARPGYVDPYASGGDVQPQSVGPSAPAPVYSPPSDPSSGTSTSDTSTSTSTPSDTYVAPPTEVATAEPGGSTSAEAAPPPDVSTTSSYDDATDKHQRVGVQLQVARTNSKLSAGRDATGVAVALETLIAPDHDGLGAAAELGGALGWTKGLDFDLRAGGGAAYRAGALTVAGVAGIGADGWGAFESGDDLHTTGVYAYVGGRAHLALGRIAIDGSLASLARTDPNELRFSLGASWLPAGKVGYAFGVSHIAFDGPDTKATFFWLGLVPLE